MGNTQNNPLIKLQNVYKVFTNKSKKIPVLYGINLEVYQGEFLVIVGPSGSGKSTLLHTMVGLETPTFGNISFMGRDISNISSDETAELRKQHVGIVFQQPNWVKSLDVVHNIAIALALHGKARYESLPKASKLIAAVGLEAHENMNPTELSVGQQQKSSFARAISTDPDILIADEPTGNLDLASGQELMHYFMELNKQGKTIIMVTHGLENVPYASRVIRVVDGEIAEEIDPSKYGPEELISYIARRIREKPENSQANRQIASSVEIKPVLKQHSIRHKLVNLIKYTRSAARSFFLVMLAIIYRLLYWVADRTVASKLLGNTKYRLANFYHRIDRQGPEGSITHSELVDISLRNLMMRRSRSMVTVGGIALGIGFTVLLISIGYGLERIVVEKVATLNQLRQLDVSLSASEAVQLDDVAISDFQEIPEVVSVMPVAAIAGKAGFSGATIDTAVYGVPRDYLAKSDFPVISGRLFEDSSSGAREDEVAVVQQELVVNESFLRLLNLSIDQAVGQIVKLNVVLTEDVDNQGEGNPNLEFDYEVLGVLSDPNDSPAVYIPLKNTRLLGIDTFSQARIEVSSPEDVTDVRRRVEVQGFRTSSVQDTVLQIEQLFVTARNVLSLAGAFALAIAAFGMFNTLTVSLLERTREVGLLKAMGMKSREVQDLFLTESVIMGLGGGVVGVLVGTLAGFAISIFLSAISLSKGGEFVFINYLPNTSLIAIITLSALIGLVTGLYPSQRATNISAMDALRYE